MFKKSLLAVLLFSVFGVANAALVNVDAVNSGHYTSAGVHNGTTHNMYSSPGHHNWLGFDLSGVTDTIISATLEVGSDSQNDSGILFNWREVSTPYADLGMFDSVAIFNDLGSGTLFAQGVHTAGVVNSFDLNMAALDALNAATSSWAVGGSHHAPDNNKPDAFGFTAGVGSQDHIKLVLETSSISAVPVPAAFWLFGTALIGFIGISRRRKVA